MNEAKYRDELCIPKWRELIAKFKTAIDGDPKPETIMEELVSIKEAAVNSGVLTPHQVSGIVARCDNYLKGEYGRSQAKA